MSPEAGQVRKKSKKQNKVVKLDKVKEDKIKPGSIPDPEQLVFALDIGTRTVIGIAGLQEDDKFKVLAAEVLEHKSRAMLDGQIHDIGMVAGAAAEIKSKLEKKLGITLTKVAIAAAGRVLKTCEVKVEREIEQGREIDHELVSSLEIEGIQLAQLKLEEEILKDDKTQFYCVGYSVINYYLNGYVISSLTGHKGVKVGADLLATFLPHVVVDSLYTVMNRIGLEVVSLTLEPIAAINVTIPKDLRLLNLALVDIGAGTSDIAITRDSSVVAYAMAPIAGDEITEKLAQHYLVNFNTAEKIKIALSEDNEKICFSDILGRKQEVDRKEALEVIKPAVELLAETISQRILEYNHKSPNAVFLIGGGSQTPGLTMLIAQQLKLAPDRVVVRGREFVQNVKFTGKKLCGPEAITPIGIAVTAQMQKGQDFLNVTINGKKIRLFNSKKLTVADSLILVGFNPSQLIGRTGKSISFELNGVKKVVRGEHGNPAQIIVNGNQASLETVLKIGDTITVVPAQNGKDASLRVSDLIDGMKAFGSITLNGSTIELSTKVYINGTVAEDSCSIREGDTVQVQIVKTVGDIIKLYEIDIEKYDVVVNGEGVSADYRLKDGDVMDLRLKPAIHEFLEQDKTKRGPDMEEKPTSEDSHADEGASSETKSETACEASYEDALNSIAIIVNGKTILLKGEKTQYIFVDIFNFIDFDLSKPQGNIVLRLNGKPAAFTDIIKPGDIIDIYWDK